MFFYRPKPCSLRPQEQNLLDCKRLLRSRATGCSASPGQNRTIGAHLALGASCSPCSQLPGPPFPSVSSLMLVPLSPGLSTAGSVPVQACHLCRVQRAIANHLLGAAHTHSAPAATCPVLSSCSPHCLRLPLPHTR